MHRCIDADFHALQRPLVDALDDPFPDFRHNHDGPDALERGYRHRRARQAEGQARFRCGIVHAAGTSDADVAIAEIHLRKQHPAIVGIETKADRNTIEDQRLLALFTAEQDGAATQTELPVLDIVIRWLEVGEQRDAIAARYDLERRDHDAASGIPFDVDVGLVDIHWIVRRIEIDDAPRPDRHLAVEIGRQTIAADFAADTPAQRQIGGVMQFLHPQREQDVLHRHLVGLEIDRTNPV